MKRSNIYLVVIIFLSSCIGGNSTNVTEESLVTISSEESIVTQAAPTSVALEEPVTATAPSPSTPTEGAAPTTSPTQTAPPTPTETLVPWPPTVESSWPQEAIAPWPTNGWSTSSPEAQGIDSRELVQILEHLKNNSNSFHSFLLIRNGYLVTEAYWKPFDGDTSHQQYSATKSIASALMGIAYKDEYFQDVNQPVVDLFPDLALDNLADNIETVSISHVLAMSSGMDWDGTLPEEILAGELEYEPGTHFKYNNPAPQLMIDAVQQMSGQNALLFANERLFSPLGISSDDVEWNMVKGDYPEGGGGLSLRSLDMAKIGYLYLNSGQWDGEEIIPASWVEMSISPSTLENISPRQMPLANVPANEYGYYWWINREMGFYAAIGYGGQLIVVFPEKNMVLVTTGDATKSAGFGHFLTLTNFVVPLTVSESPLPENPNATAELQTLINEFGSLNE